MKTFQYEFPVGSHRQSTPESLFTVLAREVAPGLIITGKDGVYTVTHRQSGYAASQYHGNLKSAQAAATKIASMLDWDRSMQELTSDMQARGEDFRKQLRRAANEQS